MASLGEMWDGPCIQGALFAEEVIRGDHAATNKPTKYLDGTL
jgi:hypothetical protein